jgi:hypothetical protein
MDMRIKKLMDLKKKGDKGLSDSDVTAKKAALGDLIDMAKDAMGSKLKGLKKVTVASNTEAGMEKGLDLAKKKLGEMTADDESEVPKTGHGMAEMMDDESEMEDESPEEEASEMESMSPEELEAMLKQVQDAIAKKKMVK